MPPGFVPADGDGRQESIFVLQQQSCQSRRGRCLDGVCPLAFCPSGLKTLREHVLCFAQAPCQMPTDHRSWTGSEKLCRQTFSQCLDNETKPREGKRLVGIAQQVSGRPGLTGCGPRPFAFYLPASRGPSLKGISGGQASRDAPPYAPAIWKPLPPALHRIAPSLGFVLAGMFPSQRGSP